MNHDFMDGASRDIEQIRHGISRAALAHDARIAKLQAELRDAYEREVGMASVVAERRQFSQELYAARQKLDIYRGKLAASETELASARKLVAERERQLAETQEKLTALSASMFGALQLRYWRLRRGRGKA